MDFSDALSLVREHTSIVQRMEFALRSDPNNDRLALGLGSARRRADRSQSTLESFAASGQIDLIKYRLIGSGDIYPVEAVADSVRAFQKSFTGAADFLLNGAKAKAKYSADIEQKTRLNLAYTFPGSLGLVFAVENERTNLFGGGDFDPIIDVFNEFLGVADESGAIDASRHMGAALISQLCSWVDVNARWDTSVDLTVKRPDGIQRGEFIPKNRFIDLSTIFQSAVDAEPLTYEVSGMLVGLDIDLGSFHLVVPGGDDYRGALGSDFIKRKTTVGVRYVAKIHEEVRRVVATGKETRTLMLQSLTPVPDGAQ